MSQYRTHTKGYQNQIHEDRNHIDHIIRNRYMGPEHHHDHDSKRNHHLKQILKQQIECGTYKKGDFLPTEKELMEKYELSRVTVRQAMTNLVQSGYARARRGIGTDVVYEKVEEQMEGVISFTEEMKKHHIEMQTTYCKMDLISPGETVARSLQIPLTEPCYCLKRVRNAVGKPMVYTITYLKKICELPTEPEPYMESLYQYLREEHGIYIESGRDTLEAALPSEEVQKALKIDAQMPIFIRTRQTFRKGGEVFEYSICYYPGNRYKYTVEL